MLEHVVLFRLKPECGDKEVEELLRRLVALKDGIPEAGIVSLRAGRHIESSPDGIKVGLVVRFRETEGLGVYKPHPLHQHVVRYLDEVCAERTAVDFLV